MKRQYSELLVATAVMIACMLLLSAMTTRETRSERSRKKTLLWMLDVATQQPDRIVAGDFQAIDERLARIHPRDR